MSRSSVPAHGYPISRSFPIAASSSGAFTLRHAPTVTRLATNATG
jgi:hypothetical protein